MSALVLLVLWAGPADAAREVPLVEAARNLDTQAVQDLLDRSADVNAPAVDGSTALHWAVHRGANELVDLLIDAGAA